jgi:hypothetical protein
MSQRVAGPQRSGIFSARKPDRHLQARASDLHCGNSWKEEPAMHRVFRAFATFPVLFAVSVTASAANLRVKAPPKPPATPPFVWTGF